MKLHIDHLAFPSFDAGETYRFYTEVMGFRCTSAFDGKSKEWGNRSYLMTIFSLGDVSITFFDIKGMRHPKHDGLPKDIRHVALAVASRAAVTAWKRRLKTHRVSYWVEDHDGFPSVYFSDPNDIMWEVTCHPVEPFDSRVAARAVDVVRQWTAATKQRGKP